MDGLVLHLPGAVGTILTGLFALLTGVVSAGLQALIRGRLVPAATLNRIEAQYKSTITESYQRERDWQTAYHRSEEARQVTAGQLVELMSIARTTEALLRALPPGPPPGGRSRGTSR